MSGDASKTLIFAFPEESEKFRRRHPLWIERSQSLFGAIDTAFRRRQMMSSVFDRFAYLYGRMCVEDFMEILLVCGNGYGAAGAKLVRSMYEHTVTLRYLHGHPEEADTFMDYHRVQQFKPMKPILETFGQGALPHETVEEVERLYAEVKDKFLVTACDCGAKRVNHTWSKLDFVAMAKKAGPIGSLVVSGYFLPLRHAHTTFGGLSERLEMQDGHMTFQHESQPDLADKSLMTAHNCLLDALDVQNERFTIPGLEQQLQICLRDFLEIWAPDSEHLDTTDVPTDPK